VHALVIVDIRELEALKCLLGDCGVDGVVHAVFSSTDIGSVRDGQETEWQVLVGGGILSIQLPRPFRRLICPPCGKNAR
jgi:hypothetical protein